MPYAKGPYASFDSLPAPDNPTIVSARKIDMKTRRYVIDEDNGGMVPMDSTAQLVGLTLAFDSGPVPRVQTAQELDARRQRVLAALEPLATGPNPSIVIGSVDVDALAPGHTLEEVEYRSRGIDPNDAVELE